MTAGGRSRSAPRRRAASALGASSTAVVSLRSRASWSIAPDTRPSGVCNAAWPANRVASQVSPNWDSDRAAAVTSSTSTWLASTRSHVRPAPDNAFAKALLARRGGERMAVRSDRLRRVGQNARVHARPVQRHRPQHRVAQRGEKCERLVQRVLEPVDLAHPRGGDPQFAERQQREEVDGVLGEHLHGGIPVLLHGTAVAAAAGDRRVQRRRPQRVAAVQRRIGDRSGVGGRRSQLPVLHPHPAQQQPVPMRREGVVLAACPHRSADDAARPDGVAAVQGRQRHQRGRAVRRDAGLVLFGRDGLPQPGDRDRERLVE